MYINAPLPSTRPSPSTGPIKTDLQKIGREGKKERKKKKKKKDNEKNTHELHTQQLAPIPEVVALLTQRNSSWHNRVPQRPTYQR